MKNKLKDRHHFAVVNSIIDKFTMLVTVSTGHCNGHVVSEYSHVYISLVQEATRGGSRGMFSYFGDGLFQFDM